MIGIILQAPDLHMAKVPAHSLEMEARSLAMEVWILQTLATVPALYNTPSVESSSFQVSLSQLVICGLSDRDIGYFN